MIDDPVQSMDPAKVDGLARVLEDAARTRQVVVFTHDARLPEAVRRMGIAARVCEVTRRAGSVVELRDALTPAARALSDARALALTKEFPEKLARRAVPNFCRQALEAAATDVVWRRRLEAGAERDAVLEELEGARRLKQLLALAMFGDAERAGDVLPALDKFGRWAADCVQACERGSHEAFGGSMMDLCSHTEDLTKQIANLR